MTGYCRVWIPGYAQIAQPLYEATRGEGEMLWGEDQRKAFQELKDMLTKGPALGLPNLMLPFTLYVLERGGLAKGVLTQQIGPSMRPCAYLSKRLDAVARGFPPCLRVVAAAALLLQDAKKLTFGAKTTVVTEHSIRSLLKEGTIKWMTGSRLMKYQLMLLEDPEVELQVTTSLNPASFLPDEHTEEGETHDCSTLLQQTWAVRSDLRTVPLKNADLQWFTDESSFVENGVRKAGYAVVSLVDTIEAQPLPTGTSAQLAELIAVTRACEMAEGQTLNLYSDSKYVHNMAHAYAALHHKRGMLDSKGNPVKYRLEIQRFMDAMQQPRSLAFMHCRGHQRGGGEVESGNRRADAAAKLAARSAEMIMVSLILDLAALEEDWEYGTEDQKLAEALEAVKQNGKWIIRGGKTLVPKEYVPRLVGGLHEGTHMGAETMYELIRKKCYAPNLSAHTRQVARKCIECAKVNPNTRPLSRRVDQVSGVLCGVRMRARAKRLYVVTAYSR
ncbi:uncharacterized protein LOC128323231 [Hemicordylus capensis]|uniref:uncharacterized protein LOC128323231 n=1 Tax=Hemicordylus capensis TaxID=884348 RepID=UPI002303AD72|nr:uncharacterized protein LOC128323231 [Hemicordylus capensis]